MKGKCRVCGCTQENCSQCIEKTGEPCHWVEDDLCSACANGVEENQSTSTEIVQDAYQDYLDKRNSSSITFTEMKFFENLKLTGNGQHLSIDIKEKNGKYTVMVLPKSSDQSRIQPIVVTGTPEELDEDFFKKVGPVLIESGMKLLNVEEHKKSVEAASKSSDKKSSSETSDKQPKGPAAAKKKIDKKGAAKKQLPKKSEEKKEETKPEETPKIVEQALF